MIRKDFLISVLPKEENEFRQIDEMNKLKGKIAKLLCEEGYKFAVAEEDMIVAVNKDELQEALIECREAIRVNLVKASVKNEQVLLKAFKKIEKFIKE